MFTVNTLFIKIKANKYLGHFLENESNRLNFKNLLINLESEYFGSLEKCKLFIWL